MSADALRAVLARLAGDPLPLAVAVALESGGPQAALECAWRECADDTALRWLLWQSDRRWEERVCARHRHHAAAECRGCCDVIRADTPCPRIEDVLPATAAQRREARGR